MDRPKLIVGARVLVYVNGKLFGRCAGFGWTSVTPHKETRVIDIQNPVELAPTTTGVQWNMTVLRTVGDGGMQGAGIVAPQDAFSRQKYIVLQLVERMSGLTIFQASMCAADNETWAVLPKDVMRGQLSGRGIIWNNEAG